MTDIGMVVQNAWNGRYEDGFAPRPGSRWGWGYTLDGTEPDGRVYWSVGLWAPHACKDYATGNAASADQAREDVRAAITRLNAGETARTASPPSGHHEHP